MSDVTTDPRRIILESPMRAPQIIVVGLCIFLNALDGFDVLSISFAAPGIAKEWGIDSAALGVVLSMELIGMAVGSILLGNVADRIGRRPTIIGCLAAMAMGMLFASLSGSVTALSGWRLLTGLGIGGMLASINAAVAEVANARRRTLSVALMSSGYPMGAVLGGLIASALLVGQDWRAVFLFGAVATAVCIPLVFWLLPESIEFLSSSRRPDALERVNRALAKLGHPPARALPPVESDSRQGSIAGLWGTGLAVATLLLTVAYFAHIMTFYFMVKWIPKIVVDMGFVPSTAGTVLVWANVGGATGALLFSLMTVRADLRRLTIGFMLLSGGAIALFGQAGGDLARLSLVGAVAGFCTNAAIIGIYALLARIYPPDLRASGTGFVIGVGRAGAALGPIAAGLLFGTGWELPAVAPVMAAGSLIAALALTLLGRRAIAAPASP